MPRSFAVTESLFASTLTELLESHRASDVPTQLANTMCSRTEMVSNRRGYHVALDHRIPVDYE